MSDTYPLEDVIVSSMLEDAASLEQADMLDNAYLYGDNYYLVNKGYPEEYMGLSETDQKFVDNWFELDNNFPNLFGYLFH